MLIPTYSIERVVFKIIKRFNEKNHVILWFHNQTNNNVHTKNCDL